MNASPIMTDHTEDLQRKLAFAEACADPLDLNGLLARASGLLFKWAQADVVTLILPPEGPALEPVLHLAGRQPVLPLAERSIRDECAQLLAEMDFAHLPGEALRLHRGPELTPLHGTIRDDYVYRFWTQPLEVDGEVVGVLALFGFTDWLLAPRIRRLLAGFANSLATAVRNAIAIQQLRDCAVYDDLTGVFNRRGLFEFLTRECARSERRNAPLAVLLVDVDHFKRINDDHGHPEGDRVLRSVGAMLQADVRVTDAVGRLGGDEFVVVLPDTDSETAGRIGARISQRLMEVTWGEDQVVSVSAGIGRFHPGQRDTIEQLMQRADDALYEAKRGGRARIADAL